MNDGCGMRWKWWVWVPLGIVTMILGGAHANVTGVSESQYRSFVDRNPFGLKPPPLPPPVTEEPTPPPVKVNIQLSGISSLGGTKRAWLVIPPGPGRTNTTYLSFREGDPEREGIRVQNIDPERGLVQILNAGIPATLDFENHGLAYSAPVAVNIPGQAQPARPGARPGRPVANPARPTVVAPGGQAATRTQGVSGTATPTVRTIPARSVRTAPQAAVPDIDPAIQAIQMRANEMRARSINVPYPPMPPIPGMP
jgi:hypothetical protein